VIFGDLVLWWQT